MIGDLICLLLIAGDAALTWYCIRELARRGWTR
jgi:hypothetical protein